MKNIVTLRKILLWFMILSLFFLISSCAKQSEEEMVQETEEQTLAELTDAVESTEKATQSKPKNSFSVTYRIYQSGILRTEKKKVGKLGTPVTFDLPETPLGYVYGAWDDGSTDARRVDTEESDGKIYTINCVPEYLGVPTIEISTADGGGITSKTSYKKCKKKQKI